MINEIVEEEMGKYSEKTKVVYLDQKDWIHLAREHYERSSSPEDRKLSDIVLSASKEGSAIFPLPLAQFSETLYRLNRESRTRLASFMIKASKGYTMFPGGSTFMEMECRNAALRKLGRPTVNLNKFVIDKGISHMLGARGEIEGELPEELKEQLLTHIESPQAMLKLLKVQDLAEETLQQKQTYAEAVERMERIRKKNLQVADNTLRYRLCFVDFFTSTAVAWLAKLLLELNLPQDSVINESWEQRDFTEFFESMPSMFCSFVLNHQRDQLVGRPIDVNDINDIWALSMAIPYCDMVVTERMWRTIACQSKLDKKYNTVISSSTEDLPSFLE